MQRIAQSWLVLDLTDSGTAVGVVLACQFLPILLLSPTAGVYADRFDKRTILYVSQAVSMVSALSLGMVVLRGSVELWMVYASALGLGIGTAFDTPTRQTFVTEMVGREHVGNAVSLNATLGNVARIIGPAIAGFLIVGAGIGWCFVINGLTYMALVVTLALMREGDLHQSTRSERAPGQLREGLRYVWAEPNLRVALLLITIAGLFAHEYPSVTSTNGPIRFRR